MPRKYHDSQCMDESVTCLYSVFVTECLFYDVFMGLGREKIVMFRFY